MGETEKKLAVWICKGCDIDKSVNVETLETLVTGECSVELCRSHEFLCGAEGVEAIKADLSEGVNTLVIGACSPRVHANTFTFDDCLTERANLREHVAWSHPGEDEDTQMLAEDYLRMSIARAQKAELPEPFDEDIDKTILVVGGGQAGMTTALEAARAGYEVSLVEKKDRLGGWLTKFKRTYPHAPPYRDLEAVDLESRVRDIEQHDRITVYTDASIEKISGQPGQFDVSIATNGTGAQVRVGAIVQATGWKPYDASNLAHLGYGRCPNVITNVQMEEMAASGAIIRPSDGKPATRVVFIQCAGSRDQDHLPYCSAVCCRVSLKQALWVRELNSEAQAFILYKDLRSPGQYEDFYKRAQEDAGIFFTKGDVIGVEDTDDHDLLVDVENTLIDNHIQVEADHPPVHRRPGCRRQG